MTDQKNPNFVLGNVPRLLLRENSLIEPLVKNPFKHVLKLKKVDKLKV